MVREYVSHSESMSACFQEGYGFIFFFSLSAAEQVIHQCTFCIEGISVTATKPHTLTPALTKPLGPIGSISGQRDREQSRGKVALLGEDVLGWSAFMERERERERECSALFSLPLSPLIQHQLMWN